jgi:hypothetical protein
MFTVIDKRESPNVKVVKIYAVEQDSNGYPKFLIYSKPQWVWVSAKHFVPFRNDLG